MARKYHPREFARNSTFDTKSSRLKDAIRATAQLNYVMKEENREAKQKKYSPGSSPAQYSVPAILYLEGLCALVLTFAHTAFASDLLQTYLNPFLFQMAIPMLFLLLGYRMARRASETGVTFYRKRYVKHILAPNFFYYILPMLFLYLICLGILLPQGVSLGDPSKIIFDFLFGRWGTSSSSVYVGWVALELIILLPILLHMRNLNEQKKPWWLLHVFLFSLLYEFITSGLDSSTVEMVGSIHDLYRFLPFRFVFAFALGMYIYQRRKRRKKWSVYVLSFLAGVAYLIFIKMILLPNGKVPEWLPLFQDRPFTSMFCSFYIFPIATVILHFAQRKSLPKALDIPFSLLGKASYYIILAQAVLFGVLEKLKLSLPGTLPLQAVLALLICSVAGILLSLIATTRLFVAISTGWHRMCYNVARFIRTVCRNIVILWCTVRSWYLKKKLNHLIKKQQKGV